MVHTSYQFSQINKSESNKLCLDQLLHLMAYNAYNTYRIRHSFNSPHTYTYYNEIKILFITHHPVMWFHCVNLLWFPAYATINSHTYKNKQAFFNYSPEHPSIHTKHYDLSQQVCNSKSIALALSIYSGRLIYIWVLDFRL